MSFRWLIISCLLVLSVSVVGYAQTMDYHIGFGMKPDKSTPPETIDMKWARQYMDDNATWTTNATKKDD